MTDETPQPVPREILQCTPGDSLRVLPTMGRVMLTADADGATHERIGVVGTVRIVGDKAFLEGDAHAAEIDLAAIATVVVDRTTKMKERWLPRFEYLGKDDASLFRLIALDGLDPFERAVAELGAGTPVPAREKPESTPKTLEDSDPGLAPFAAAAGKDSDVAIAFQAPGVRQSWRGRIAEVKPMMGFINIIQPDFHLHLAGGAVGSWQSTIDGNVVTLTAVTPAGQPTGLVVSGPADVLGHA